MFCSRCAGSGQIHGNGMILIECSQCFGTGDCIPEEKAAPIDKKSKAYKTAIKEIMALNPSIKYEEAVKMFEQTYDKV